MACLAAAPAHAAFPGQNGKIAIASQRDGAGVSNEIYVMNPDGSGQIEPIAQFMTNPAGAAVVNAVGPIRQIVQSDAASLGDRRYLIVAASDAKFGIPEVKRGLVAGAAIEPHYGPLNFK